MVEQSVVLVAIGREQESVLASLFELYVHDFSEQVPLELKQNGRFDLPLDQRWWTSADHFPFFVQRGGQLAGFALVRRASQLTGDPRVMDVAEFFIVRGHRGRGVGSAAARALLERFPGPWELRIRRSNDAGRGFWLRVVRDWLGRDALFTPFIAKGVEWELLKVDTQRSASP